MNSYEQKQADKKEYYEGKAEKFNNQSDDACSQAISMGNQIPFGQPILVGHHSEKGHRSLLNKIDNKFRKSFELSDKSKYYEDKAASVGKCGISSDDPDAVEKIQSKIDRLQNNIDYSKKINAKLRKFKTKSNALNEVASLPDDDEDKSMFETMLKSCDFWASPPDRIGAYYLNTTSDNAEINRLKKRLKTLEATKDQGTKTHNMEGFTVVENVEQNRLQIIFEGKPSEAIRKALKKNGYRWSPRNTAWQRQLTNNAKYCFQFVAKDIKEASC